MKNIIAVLALFLAPAVCPAQGTPTPGPSDSLAGIYDGRTPCRELAMQLRENTSPDCIKIKWRLVLYKDPVTNQPGTYNIWGFIFKRDRTNIGKWHILKGTKNNPDAIVYQLDYPGRPPLYLQKGDDNILFFLDQDKQLMVGNNDFSYTLNRVK
jgi:hypothetical protein